jgi:ornithine carbamoyltransferase
MPFELHHRLLWSGVLMRQAPLLAMIDAAKPSKASHGKGGSSPQPLRGAHVAVLSARPSRVPGDFDRAAADLGAQLASLNAAAWLATAEASPGRVPEAAHMLGRLYGLVDVSDLDHAAIEQIEQYARVPVLDGLARADHEFHLLAELMTMRELAGRPFAKLRLRIAGARKNPLHVAATQAAKQLKVKVVVREPEVALAHGVDALPDDRAPTDFVLDVSAPIAAGRLSLEHAPAVDAGRWLSEVAGNRQLLLQTALQAVFRAAPG